MKQKEGRDYLGFKDCVASFKNGEIRLSNMAETFTLSKKEFAKLVAFVNTKEKDKNTELENS